MGQLIGAIIVILLLLGGGAWLLFGPQRWDENDNMDFSDRWGPIGGKNVTVQTDDDDRDEADEDPNYRGL